MSISAWATKNHDIRYGLWSPPVAISVGSGGNLRSLIQAVERRLLRVQADVRIELERRK
jgi:hypothetical protein